MMKISTMIGAGLLALATTIQPAEAIPLLPIPNVAIGTDHITAVYFRRGFYRAGGFYYYNGYRASSAFGRAIATITVTGFRRLPLLPA